MRVPSQHTTTAPARRLAVGTLVLGLAVAACGSSPTPTSAPSAEVPTATASAAPATTPVSATATPVPATTPSPTASLEAMTLLWQQGGPATDKTSTVATAIDPVSGNVWVAVPFENKYWIFSPDGKYLESWGKAGTGNGQFDFSDHAQNPDGWGAIAFAPDGSFYVGDTGNHRVQAFDAKRRFQRQWGTFGSDDGQFVQIDSLATDGHTVYVGDGERHDVQAFDGSGTFIRSFGSEGGFDFLALDAMGGIHATNPQNTVGAPMAMAIFGPDGALRSTTDLSGTGGMPQGVAVDGAGNSYASIEMDHSPWTALGIVEIDPTGRVVRKLEGGGGDTVTVTSDGDALYATRGIQLDPTIWTYVRKYALPKP